MMDQIYASPILQRALLSIFIILIANLVTILIVRIINRSIKDLKRRYLARKMVFFSATFLSILIIVSIWIKRTASLTTILSVVGAGLTLALHQAILSIAGWFLIWIRRPYEIGDRVEIFGIKGDVIDIRLFYTTVLEIGNWVDSDQSTGRMVHIPNGKIFTEAIFNYTRGFEFLWNEIKVVVTFESDWKKAEHIILDIASSLNLDLGDKIRSRIQRMSRKYMIHYEKLTPYVWTNIVDFGVELTLRYLTDARKRRSTQHEICRAIIDRFNREPDVEFAYPTYRIYKRGEEAFPESGAEIPRRRPPERVRSNTKKEK